MIAHDSYNDTSICMVGLVFMVDRLFLNNEVAKITGLSQRQIISLTEKGLVCPVRPAQKAGTMRGYNYLNLLELGLAKCLMDIIGVQVFTAKMILDDLRYDGEMELWASNYSAYRLSFTERMVTKGKKNEGGDPDFSITVRDNDPTGLGGTLEYIPSGIDKKEDEEGVLYYIILNEFPEKKYKTTMRIISPWDLSKTLEAFDYQGDIQEIIDSNGMITVNMSKIKREIDHGIKKLG